MVQAKVTNKQGTQLRVAINAAPHETKNQMTWKTT